MLIRCETGLRGEGKPDHERRPLPQFAFSRNGAAMLIDDHRTRNGQSLPGSLAHLFGGEERIEDLRSNRLGDASTGVRNTDLR